MPFSKAVIYPYKRGSRSAKKLTLGLSNLLRLKVRRVYADGKYRPKLRSLFINYGSSQRPFWYNFVPQRALNDPQACFNAGNKLRAFNIFKENGLAIPDFTTSKQMAQSWLSDGDIVVCRTLLSAYGGRGIILSGGSQNRPLVDCQLYVKYKKKKKEYRVHVFNGQVIHVAEKRRMRRERRPEEFDGFIRNHANGWIFASNDVVAPADLSSLAISGCHALNINFGAADIVWNKRENKCYLLEVNTAPGLEGVTLSKYTKAIYNWIRSN